jgi:pimeloyl-ACP methyl ester carboxylesterase
MAEGHLRAVDAEWQSEFELQFRTIHGYRRAYVHAGPPKGAPALLLLHGIGDSSATWSHLIPGLAEHFTVVAPDLLGHGASDRPRADYSPAAYACGMRDLLASLDVDRVTVVGHSLGGGIAMQLAYQFPQLCERLVLVSSGGAGRAVHPLLRLATAPGAEAVMPLVTNPAAVLGGRLAARVLLSVVPDVGREVDEVVRTLAALPDRASRQAFCRTLRSVVDGRGQRVTLLDRCYLAEAIPTMLVWGDRDAVIPVEHAHTIASAMPAARLELFRGAGHFPHHHDAARFLATLVDFCRTPAPEHDDVSWRELLRRGRLEASVADAGSARAEGGLEA